MITKVDLHNLPFLNEKEPKNGCYAWTSVLLLDSIININKKFYPLVFSNECKYIVSKEKLEIMNSIDEELIIDDSGDDSYEKIDEC